MRHWRRLLPLVLLLALLLSGCAAAGADELYSLPKRSDAYLELQQEIESVMRGASYAAPVSGVNQRSIQNADLDGDGLDEVLVFARTEGAERPLKVFILRQDGDVYRLLDTIESDGAAFDSVDYVQIDGRAGLELVLSCRLADKVQQSMRVYTVRSGKAAELLQSGCTAYTVTDLNGDGLSDVITLTSGGSRSNGIAQYFRWREDELLRSGEANLSVSAESVKRIITGLVAESVPGVFVASTYDDSNIVTDVFVAPSDGTFRNVSQMDENDLSTSTVRSYYVYSTDIDGDGVIELPETRPLVVLPGDPSSRGQSCILWYNLRPDGTHVENCTTYHNYAEGWYLRLPDEWRSSLSVTTREDEVYGSCTCFVISDYISRHELLRVYMLEGKTATDALDAGALILLERRGNTYYCAAPGAELTLDSATLQESFGFILTDTTP